MNIKGLGYATGAPILYGLGNVIIEQELKGVSNLCLMIIFNATILALALLTRQLLYAGDASYAFPRGSILLWAFSIALVFFVAEYMYLGSYGLGVSVYAVTALTMLIPVFASLFRLFWVAEIPNGYLTAGYAFGAVAIVLVIIGSMQPDTPPI